MTIGKARVAHAFQRSDSGFCNLWAHLTNISVPVLRRPQDLGERVQQGCQSWHELPAQQVQLAVLHQQLTELASLTCVSRP